MYLAAPWLFLFLTPMTAALMVLGLFAFTLLVDLVLARPIWMPLHFVPLGLFLLYFLYTAARMYVRPEPATLDLVILAGIVAMWIGLSSEVITSKRRRRWLIFSWLGALVLTLTLTMPESIKISRSYIHISLIAAASRLFFPPAGDLLHTSLDYRFVRMELLSRGMKRVVAAGLRWNKVGLFP